MQKSYWSPEGVKKQPVTADSTKPQDRTWMWRSLAATAAETRVLGYTEVDTEQTDRV